MRVWERLIKWADDEAASARNYRRLAEVAELHAAGQREPVRDPELQWRSIGAAKKPAERDLGLALTIRICGRHAVPDESKRGARGRAGGTTAAASARMDAEHEKAETQARNARRMLWAAVISSGVRTSPSLVVSGLIGLPSLPRRAERKLEESSGSCEEPRGS